MTGRWRLPFRAKQVQHRFSHWFEKTDKAGEAPFLRKCNLLCSSQSQACGSSCLKIPPRNVNWSASGRWVHRVKIAFETYFLRKMRRGESEPFYEKAAMQILGIGKLKRVT